MEQFIILQFFVTIFIAVILLNLYIKNKRLTKEDRDWRSFQESYLKNKPHRVKDSGKRKPVFHDENYEYNKEKEKDLEG